MRKYTPKGNVQKKAKYNDRFWVAPSVPRSDYHSDKHFSEVIENLSKEVKVLDSYIELGQLVVEIEAEENLKALKNLKSGSCYEMCSELSAVDYLSQSGEFEIFYQLLNLKKSKRVRVITRIKRGEAIESVVSIYKMANFAEREMYDMFGIYVNNHPYLKRIIMPDDWEGHPLLKDYPVEGDEFASWYEVDKIFGKEYRDVIGPEIRDQAMVDRYDTQRFARVGKEVPFGSNPEKADEAQTPISYSKARFTNYTKGSKELDKRK